MEKTLKQLREERADIVKRLNDLEATRAAEQRDAFHDEEKTEFDSLMNELSNKDLVIETQERSEQLKTVTSKNQVVSTRNYNAPRQEDKDLNFRAWALRQSGHSNLITRDMKEASTRLGFDLDQPNYTIRAGQSVADNAELVNDEVVMGIIEKQKAYGGLQSLATVINTPDGNPLRWIKNDSTGASAGWVDELDAVTATDMTFTKIVYNAYHLATAVFPVSNQVIRDSRIPLQGFVYDVLGTRLGRGLATALVTGDGSGKPRGILDATAGVSTGKTCADDTTFTLAEVRDLIHSVDLAYRNGAKLVMNDSTWKTMKVLMLAEGMQLVQNNAFAFPMSFDGYEVVLDNAYPAVAAAKKIITFGRHSDYLIRQVNSIELRVSKELYWKEHAIAFSASGFYDGAYAAYDSVKCLLTAAS